MTVLASTMVRIFSIAVPIRSVRGCCFSIVHAAFLRVLLHAVSYEVFFSPAVLRPAFLWLRRPGSHSGVLFLSGPLPVLPAHRQQHAQGLHTEAQAQYITNKPIPNTKTPFKISLDDFKKNCPVQ